MPKVDRQREAFNELHNRLFSAPKPADRAGNDVVVYGSRLVLKHTISLSGQCMFEQSFRSVESDQTCGKGLRWGPPATRIPRVAQSFTMLSFIYVLD